MAEREYVDAILKALDKKGWSVYPGNVTSEQIERRSLPPVEDLQSRTPYVIAKKSLVTTPMQEPFIYLGNEWLMIKVFELELREPAYVTFSWVKGRYPIVKFIKSLETISNPQ